MSKNSKAVSINVDKAIEAANRTKRKTPFKKELTSLLNKYSQENGSNTPDFILAEYLLGCIDVFNKAHAARFEWFGSGLTNKKEK